MLRVNTKADYRILTVINTRLHSNTIYWALEWELLGISCRCQESRKHSLAELLIKWNASHCRGVKLPKRSGEFVRKKFYWMKSPVFL